MNFKNAILEYKDHPRMRVINVFQVFIFHQLIKILFLQKLQSNKAVQDIDIPVKIFEGNADCFTEYIYLQYNEAISSSYF